MMYRKLMCLILMSVIIGCGGEPRPEVTADILKGRWEILEAFRDGRLTQTLNKGYFVFQDSQLLKTNILNDTSFYNYNIAKNQLLVESPQNVNYTVSNIQDDTLTLKARIRNFDFKFVAVKNLSDDSE